MKFCQSCAMPMAKGEDYGTNKDGSINQDYCVYCYKDGVFTSECSMDEMIDFCVPHMVAANPKINEDEAKNQMKAFFPTLKRWKDK